MNINKCNHGIAGLVLVSIMGIAIYIIPVMTNAAEPISKKLTPKLNELLTDEMRSIRQAMTHILDGLIVGDHSIVENMASQIKASFILQQQLSEKDKKDLMAVAPQAFLKLDGEFHETAGKLSQAAQAQDYELQRYYFSKLIDSCQACHSEYVTDKFPGFSGAAPAGHVH